MLATVAASVPQNQNTNHGVESPKKNKIQVSNTKKPLFFYVNLAKVNVFFDFFLFFFSFLVIVRN